MSTASSVGWLLVGTGDIARKRVAPALGSVPDSRLVGVCDVVPERARALAAEFNAAEVHADYAAALRSTAANAVYVATPVGLHVDFARRALEAGKHVLVEKPLGLTAADAELAVQAAAGSHCKAGCAYYRRFFPCYLHAADMLRQGQFGRVVLVRLAYYSWFNPAKDDPKYWRVVRARGGGGPLADMGTHMFDVMIGLFGLPRRLFANARTVIQPYPDVEDSAAMVMELENGADVVATFHWNSKTWLHEFEIVGTEARVRWQPYDSGRVGLTVDRDSKELDLPNAPNVHAPIVADFVRAVIEDRAPAVTLAEAAKTNRLIDAIYESAATRKEIVL